MKPSSRAFTSLLLLGASLFLTAPINPLAADTVSPGKPYSWRLQPDVPILEFEVTDALREAGTYVATFQYKRGDNALKIKSVALYAGDEKISEDTHVGETGIANLKNVYAFELPKASSAAGPYTLRARVEGVGGTSSFGVVTVRKANPGEIPQLYSWRLKPDVTTLQFDVTNAIGEPGAYSATFQYKRGAHALNIKSVAIYAGDRKVSEDAHAGVTGIDNQKNVYAFQLPKATTNAEVYTLRAQVEDISKGNTFGTVTVRKVDRREPSRYAWELAPDVTVLKFDVADAVIEAGTYIATVQWKQGVNALKISSVALYEGDKKVAEDVHEGWTGFESRSNSYTLELSTYRTGQEAYTLSAQVEGAAGTDCSGILTLEKIK